MIDSINPMKWVHADTERVERAVKAETRSGKPEGKELGALSYSHHLQAPRTQKPRAAQQIISAMPENELERTTSRQGRTL